MNYRLHLLLLAFLIPIQSILAQPSVDYHLLRELHIGGIGGWDYIAVNASLNRIYVSHGTQVEILDKTTGDSVGVIPRTEGVHGIAFAGDNGFTSNGRSNNVTVFDLKTNRVLEQISTGENPDAIMYEPFTKTIVTCNGRSKDLSFIDAVSHTVIKTVAVDGRPETAVTDGAGNVYVNLEDKNEIAHVNLKTFAVEHRWKIGKGEEPTGLAYDLKNQRLFIGCGGNKLMVVMNATNGSVVAELPIGEGCDGVVYDAATGDAFAANRDGTLTVVHENGPDSFTVTSTIPTKRGARTLALDEKTHHLFLPTASSEPVAPTSDNPRPRPKIIPGTFEVLEIGK